MSKSRKTGNNGYNRWEFKIFLYLTIVVYSILYLNSDNIDIASMKAIRDLNSILITVIIGNFACIITATSIFCVFDTPTLLTKESKIWFIDSILLAMCNLIYSLIFLVKGKQTLFFIVIISCLHTFGIFHYYLRERFKSGNGKIKKIEKTIEKNNESDEEVKKENNVEENIKNESDEEIKKENNAEENINNDSGFIRTLIDMIFILGPVIYILVSDFKFDKGILTFYIIFITYIAICVFIKEFYLEKED